MIATAFAVVSLVPAWTISQAAELESRLVAIYESEAGGLPDHTYDTFYAADISDDGLLLFRGDTRTPSNAKREAVWKEISPGQVVLVGSNRDEPPADGFEFDKAKQAYWQSSDVIHAEWPNDPSDPKDAIWRFRYEPGNDSQQRLAFEGDAGPLPNTTYLAVSNLRSNALNDVAFSGAYVDNDSQASSTALFFRRENGPVEIVAREGDAAPGDGVFTSVGAELKLAPNGSVWFQASTSTGPRILSYQNGALTQHAATGQQPSWLGGSSDISSLNLCSVNSAGHAAFWGQNADGQRFVASSDGASVSQLWLEPADRFTNKTDGPRPDGGVCKYTNAGEMVIQGMMISGGFTVYTPAILGFSSGSARAIVEEGMPVPAVPGASFSQTSGAVYDFNGSDDMALLTSIEGDGIDNSNNEVLLLGKGADDFVVVARTGQLREVRPGFEAPIINLTQFAIGGVSGAANFLSEDGSVAYAAYIDNKGAYFVSAPGDVILADGFEDPPHLLVNSVEDADDISPGDEKCDTGDTIAGGDPECTLRAAIQEINAGGKASRIQFAIPGPAPHVIQLLDSLPPITRIAGSIRGPQMVGGVVQVVVDGSATGSLDGIVVDAEAVRIKGLGIQGFDSAGVTLNSPGRLYLSSVHISGNCGFGVHAMGEIYLADTWGGPSLIDDNGNGPGCEGGGLFSAKGSISHRSVQVFNSTISNNNGPGILSDGPIWLAAVNVENNAAQGVSVQGTSANIHVTGGNTYVAGNHGNGVESLGGGFDVDSFSSVDIRLNGGWGLVTGLDGRINFGEELIIPTQTSFIQFNGKAGGDCEAWTILEDSLSKFTEPCVGGGIAAQSEPAIAHRLANLVIEDNGAPGLVAESQVKLRDVTIRRNDGAGVFVYLVDAQSSNDVVVRAELGVNEISGNLGHGIVAEYGKVVANAGAELHVRDNAGWGIVLQGGVAELGVTSIPDTAVRTIIGNGFEEECFEWVYDEVTDAILPDPFHLGACPGGGVYSADFRSSTSFFGTTSISGNNGPGILTEARVKLSQSTISENESSGIRIVDADNATGGIEVMVSSFLGGNELFSNKGHGIHVETGSVELEESLSMELNQGYGILLESGDVDMLQASGDMEKSIIQHGPGGPCRLWDIPPADYWSSEVVTCGSGGILVMDGDISGRLMIIRSNAGDGLNASGNMTLIDSTVCDNTGDQIVTGGVETLSNVDIVCGQN